MTGQPGFFDLDERYAALSAAGDPLEKLSATVDFELFRPVLKTALRRSDRSKGGRPPYDPVLMFKILVLQALYSLGDDAAEFLIRDRLSFMRFLGLGLGDTVPDAKTIWLFREHLVRAKAMEKLFARFDAALAEKGYLAMGGQIIDATVVASPRQKLTEDDKAAVRGGGIPGDWSAAKRAQKDTDARWTIKRGRKREGQGTSRASVDIAVPVFGYKNHIGTDRRFGLIRRWTVTDAAAHDSRAFRDLIDRTNLSAKVWADTAYRSKKHETFLSRRGLVSMIQFKRPRGAPMPAHHAKANAARAKVRGHVEHVFAAQKHRMGLFVRTIGLERARAKIGMANLVYNLTRFVWLEARAAPV